MGDLSDYFTNKQINELLGTSLDTSNDIPRLEPKSIVWKTKDGTEMFLEDMNDAHLMNTLKFLYRKNAHPHYTEAFVEELKRRGKQIPKRPLIYTKYQDL